MYKNMRTPAIPNTIIGEGKDGRNKVIGIEDLSDMEIEILGMQWTEKLKKTSKSQKEWPYYKKGPNDTYQLLHETIIA